MEIPWDIAEMPGDVDPEEETSVWPLLAALALALFFLLLSLSWVLGIVGLLAVIVAVGGWVWVNGTGYAEREPREPPADTFWMRHDKLVWGSVMLVISEVLLFDAVFVAMAAYQVTVPPLDPHIAELNTPGAALATLALMASALSGWRAGRNLHAERRRRALGWLGATMGLGIAFLAYETVEAAHLYAEGFTITSSHVGTVFFGLTGLHAFHVFLGLVALGILTLYLLRGNLRPGKLAPFQAVMIYWYFVAAQWIPAYVSLYLHLI